jgi:hypothetical protein
MANPDDSMPVLCRDTRGGARGARFDGGDGERTEGRVIDMLGAGIGIGVCIALLVWKLLAEPSEARVSGRGIPSPRYRIPPPPKREG